MPFAVFPISSISPMSTDGQLRYLQGIAARQRSRYLRFARPPQEKQLIESRKKTIREKKATAMFWNTIVYVVFLAVTLVIAFGKDNHTPYMLNQSVITSFSTGDGLRLSEIKTPADWWTWSTTHFLDNAFWETWYNGQSTTSDVGKTVRFECCTNFYHYSCLILVHV